MRTLPELRKEQNLTQMQLASRLKVTTGTVYNWERGRAEPKARQIVQLAAIFGVTADEVIAALPGINEEAEAGKELAAACAMLTHRAREECSMTPTIADAAISLPHVLLLALVFSGPIAVVAGLVAGATWVLQQRRKRQAA